MPISNANMERQIRTFAICRKNSLFVGSLDSSWIDFVGPHAGIAHFGEPDYCVP